MLDEVPALVCFIFHPELGLLTVKASVVVVVAMTGPNNALFLLLPPLPPRAPPRSAAAPICHKRRCVGWLVSPSLGAGWITQLPCSVIYGI